MKTDRFVIRAALVTEIDATVQIEDAADELLRRHLDADAWPPSTTADERAAQPGFVLVAEEAPSGAVVGFVHVLQVEDHAHLEQVSVLPRCGGIGVGRMLVEAAKSEARQRGYEELTLRTYRDVPWNAPFYASCGFRATRPSTPFLERLVDVEAALGLDRYGVRLQMTADL